MTPYLCVATVGPVQSFLETARRTRDLWAGSGLLSNISRSVAEHLKNQGAMLIFPHEDSLNRKDDPIVNFVWAWFDDASGETMRQHLSGAHDRARTTFADAAEYARKQVAEYINGARWQLQVKEDIVEFYYAFAAVTENDYAEVRRKLTTLLAARKQSRNFSAWSGSARVPKSSLDGARESVWDHSRMKDMPKSLAARLRLNEGEELDVVGMAKRLGMGNEKFPSVSRLAADAWIRGLDEAERHPLITACERLRSTGLIWYKPEAFPQLQIFPYEGAAVFETRHDEILKIDEEPLLGPLKAALADAVKHRGVPNPYVAVLIADGDGIGKVISSIKRREDHQRFSKRLSAFAAVVKDIVQGHNGALVYAGGDDVLAMLPPDTAIECADELRKKFSGLMEDWKATLSVGVGIGHSIGEDMEDLLRIARAAEKDAKASSAKNSLGIRWATRGAEPVRATFPWTGATHTRLYRFTQFFLKDELPDGAVYQLWAMAQHYASWDDNNLKDAIQADACRLLTRKQAAPSEIRELLNGVTDSHELMNVVNELLLARRFAAVYRQSRRTPGGPVS